MATQTSLNLNRRETCWAILTTIKIHQMREEFGEKMQKPLKTLVRKNVFCIPIICFCCNSCWLNFHSISFFTMWTNHFLRILFWMASGFKYRIQPLTPWGFWRNMGFPLCFPVDFYPPSPPNNPPKNICSEGWWTSFLLASPRSCQRWAEELPCRFQEERMGAPQGIGAA